MPALTEVLLNDAEVNRSAASVEEPSVQAGIGSTTPVIGVHSNQEGDTVTSAVSFRSRRVSPTRLCPLPAVLRPERADSEGRAANTPGKTILVQWRFYWLLIFMQMELDEVFFYGIKLCANGKCQMSNVKCQREKIWCVPKRKPYFGWGVSSIHPRLCTLDLHRKVHVRFWGQHYTDAVWEGVLEALRAAPTVLLSGEAGSVAGVPKLLEAYLGLVAVQVSGALIGQSGFQIASCGIPWGLFF